MEDYGEFLIICVELFVFVLRCIKIIFKLINGDINIGTILFIFAIYWQMFTEKALNIAQHFMIYFYRLLHKD